MEAESDTQSRRLVEVTDLLSAAGQQLQLAEHARAEALAGVARLARAAHGLLPVSRIAELSAVSEADVHDMLNESREQETESSAHEGR